MFGDISSATNNASVSGPSAGALVWSSGGPALRMEDAVVETV